MFSHKFKLSIIFLEFIFFRKLVESSDAKLAFESLSLLKKNIKFMSLLTFTVYFDMQVVRSKQNEDLRFKSFT